MRTRICYEWDLETVDNDGDVVDHNHVDRASELLATMQRWGKPPEGQHYRLALVRDERESWDGEPGALIDRNWAYIETRIGNPAYGQLPECFSAAGPSGMVPLPNMRVPKRLHTELTRAQIAKALATN